VNKEVAVFKFFDKLTAYNVHVVFNHGTRHLIQGEAGTQGIVSVHETNKVAVCFVNALLSGNSGAAILQERYSLNFEQSFKLFYDVLIAAIW
jgi:hypothetical protein